VAPKRREGIYRTGDDRALWLGEEESSLSPAKGDVVGRERRRKGKGRGE
jgi:hypothetical protein